VASEILKMFNLIRNQIFVLKTINILKTFKYIKVVLRIFGSAGVPCLSKEEFAASLIWYNKLNIIKVTTPL
jgi:hypothetical protein